MPAALPIIHNLAAAANSSANSSANNNFDGPLTEEQTKAIFKVNELYNLNCYFAELVMCTFSIGFYTMMLIRYVQHSKEDSWWIKGTVAVASAVLYGASAFVIFFVHFLVIGAYGTYIRFLQTDKYGWLIIIDTLCTATVQSFFAHRAFRLTGRNWFILITLTALILTTVAAAAASSHIFSKLPNVVHTDGIRVTQLLWLSAMMAADLIITASILYGLYNSRTGWKKTDKIISGLTRMTLEAQIPPLILATVYLIEFSIQPSNMLAAPLLGFQSHLYCIGMLYSLNSRERWREEQASTMNTAGRAFQLSDRAAATIQVDIETETYETRVDRSPHHVFHRPQETIKDAEWDDEEKTQAYGSLSSAKVGTPVSRSETSNSGAVNTVAA